MTNKDAMKMNKNLSFLGSVYYCLQSFRRARWLLLISILLILASPETSIAKMFKWVDENGKTHYTDSANKIPKNYRTEVEVSGINLHKNPSLANKKSSSFKIPTEGFGEPIGENKATGKTSSEYCAKGIEEFKRWEFLQITQMGFGCGEKAIARPVGDWDCKEIKAKSASCRNKKIQVKCSVQVQCVLETPEYNRAKYKKIMELVSEEGREERERERKELGEEIKEEWKKLEKKFAKELEGKKCDNYYANLSLCKPFSCKFVHPFVGLLMEKKIIGLKGGKCITTEQMPNNGKMSCALTEDMRKAISKSPAKEGISALKESMNNGQCEISGY